MSSPRDAREGRNVFGFELRFTPAKPYHSQSPEGLYEEASRLAHEAADYQEREVDREREWDVSQAELLSQILTVKGTYDSELQAMTGCNPYSGDDIFLACVDHTADIEIMPGAVAPGLAPGKLRKLRRPEANGRLAPDGGLFADGVPTRPRCEAKT